MFERTWESRAEFDEARASSWVCRLNRDVYSLLDSIAHKTCCNANLTPRSY
jgi:hypothetical protein